MKWISTTIKKQYFIELGNSKFIERKGDTKFWRKRLLKLIKCNDMIGINFLCGRLNKKFIVKKLVYLRTITAIDIDGKEWERYFAIHLGKRLLILEMEGMKKHD